MIQAHTILELIPLIISIWTGLTLAWGVFIGCWFDKLIHSLPLTNHREEDNAYVFCIWCANVIIFLLGFVVPFALPAIRGSVGDAVVVINVFYTSFLVCCTYSLAKWSMSQSQHAIPERLSELE